MTFLSLPAIFIVVTLVEVYLLALVGGAIGPWPTVGLVVLTGIAGGSLARLQGIKVLLAIRTDLEQARMPTDHILSGLLVLVGGVLLLTPGILTDVTGLLLMIPGNRRLLIPRLKAYFKHRFHIEMHGARPFGSPPVHDVESRIIPEEDAP